MKKIVILAMSLLLLSLILLPKKAETSSFVEHYVSNGETVWSIAETYSDGEIDVRKIVYDIRKANDIDDCIIHSGDRLLIPAKYVRE